MTVYVDDSRVPARVGRLNARWKDLTMLRITDTYQLPPEPPVGTRLWDTHGREWVHDRAGRLGWTCGTYPSADWWRATWAGLLAMGPLCTVPPAAEERP